MAQFVGGRLVALLRAYGVRYVFGVPGGQTLGLYQGILEQPVDDPRAVGHVLLRDERSCSFAADAFARLSATTGVCDATVGPGATNLTSGLAEAHASSVPLVAIVSDIPRAWGHLRRRGVASQGLEQADMFGPMTKWRGRVEVPEAITDVVDTAFRVANVGRPGPVLVEIPDDVFPATLPEDEEPPTRRRPTRWPWYRPAPDPDCVGEAIELLARARRPLVVAGGGALASGAELAIGELGLALGAPIATTISGKGAVREDDPWSLGVIGSMGRPYANDLAVRADVVVVFGSKLGQGGTLAWDLPAPRAKVIHIDIDPEVLGQARDSIGIWADARLAAEALRLALVTEPSHAGEWDVDELVGMREEWLSSLRQARRPAGPLRPQDVVDVLNEALRDDDLLVCDASLASGWGAVFRETRTIGRSFLAPRGMAGLGWGAPAAIGAALAAPERRVVSLAGDGAWAYSMGEVESMARLRLPILSVVLNNRTLAWLKHVELQRFGGRHLSADFTDTDFAAAADALGARGSQRIDTLEDLRLAVKAWSGDAAQVPTVLDVSVSEEETPVLKFSSQGMGGY